MAKKLQCLLLVMVTLCFALCSCNNDNEIHKGTDNDKLVGSWILIGEVYNRYFEFMPDGSMRYATAVTTETTEKNDQFCGEVPVVYWYKEFKVESEVEIYPEYSYTDGYGLEYKKNKDSNDIVRFTKDDGCRFVFDNENTFRMILSHEVYYGYRLKNSLLSDIDISEIWEDVGIDAQVQVPNIINLSKSDALMQLNMCGLVYEIIEKQNSTVPNGTVISTEPQEGTSVKDGSTVKVYVSAGQ